MSTHRNRTLRRIKRRLEWYSKKADADLFKEMNKYTYFNAWYNSPVRNKWMRTIDILYKFRI